MIFFYFLDFSVFFLDFSAGSGVEVGGLGSVVQGRVSGRSGGSQ